jgi:hypothetical protein
VLEVGCQCYEWKPPNKPFCDPFGRSKPLPKPPDAPRGFSRSRDLL